MYACSLRHKSAACDAGLQLAMQACDLRCRPATCDASSQCETGSPRAPASGDARPPRLAQLGILTCTEPRTPSEVLTSARALLAVGGARLVLVKHLAHAGLSPTEAFEMLLVSRDEAWHVSTPLLPFSRPPVGVGDLTSGLFLAQLLLGRSPKEALQATASAYFEVIAATSAIDEYELQLVAAQDHLVRPRRIFEARPLPR